MKFNTDIIYEDTVNDNIYQSITVESFFIINNMRKSLPVLFGDLDNEYKDKLMGTPSRRITSSDVKPLNEALQLFNLGSSQQLRETYNNMSSRKYF